ncbi:hypothetical protein PYCCODRAFT_1432933 [Trametes coccinea BRFM310]|uniref:Uncharacterized protein n=1 Tax=Trametes coccinea (strain BRFM310) TaxID=1353009 RepID=A0A1Y2IVP4_TRAC3|nr:hypothetical protein PYCCODRAFT_1432933 [Trametes coccinea BRFM310]
MHTDPKDPYNYPARDTLPNVRNAHNKHCALCSPYRDWGCLYENDDSWEIWQVLNSSPKGLAQLRWMKAANLAPHFDVSSADNHLPLCGDHADVLRPGKIVLCPALEDLDVMIEFEENDWNRRVQDSEVAVHESSRRVPSLKELSGYFHCLWLGPQPNNVPNLRGLDVSFTEVGQPGADDEHEQTFPQQVLFEEEIRMVPNVRLPTVQPATETSDALARLDHGLLLNPPNKPSMWRLNPYACLTHALGFVNGAYIPADMLYRAYDRKKKCYVPDVVPLRVLNPLDEYEWRLLKLRRLYSRTASDLQLQRNAKDKS